ncbi:hypothetical protein N0V90_000304 [Kalmusia sp. IMI 367209]|nr:hypothetical protein N0V90_000304 [Kalmusia sp. IMI 367209]
MVSKNLAIALKHKEILEELGSREPATTLEAQAVLESIRIAKGYLDEETLQDLYTIRDRSRRTILDLVEKSRETEAAYTKSISEQLYSSRYRFLYELIQNADDSNYSKARQTGDAPFLRFKITPTTFVAETNENGFTRANVEAICATGKSSKKATALDNHIGEKGFGFKSVFSISDEVLVQSGIWSFRFQHKRGEDGLGMVTPRELAPALLPVGIATRITLNLSQSEDINCQRLLDEIVKIPDTTLLHLHNLHRIEIWKSDSDRLSTIGICRSSTNLCKWATATLIKTCVDNGDETTQESLFYTFKHKVTSMPQDNHRRDRTSAEVELAFPIHTDTQKPKLSLSGQHVYAYLPLYQLPIQFIIQSDFITSASRESVIECAWNDALRNAVAVTFCDAITAFANSFHPLRHSWLDYLPKEEMRNSFWQPLYPSITSRLRNMPVLQTWQGRLFKLPTQLCALPAICVYRDNPIFKDLSDEIYLSQEYGYRQHNLLSDLGLKTINWNQILSRIEADLVSSDSRVKNYSKRDSWHVACSKMIVHAYRSGDEALRQRIKRLAIIPINNGKSWTGAPGILPGRVDNIYFPTTEGIEIPRAIGLHMVDVIASRLTYIDQVLDSGLYRTFIETFDL